MALTPAQVTIYVPSETGDSDHFPALARFEVTEVREALLQPWTGDLTWESSNPAIATVDADGTVRAVSAGTVVVTVSPVENVSIVATASVSVKEGGRLNVLLE